MIDGITNYIENNRTRTSPAGPRFPPTLPRRCGAEEYAQRSGFTKVFRWPNAADQTRKPASVEVVGSFSDWQKVPLAYDKATRTWAVTLNNIQSNHTHRYAILVDGKPSYDKNCDGLTVPREPKEEKWQIATPKGPRIMLLFAQTK